VNFRRLKPEDSFEFHSDAAGAVTRVVYRQSPIDIVEARREGEAWTASRREVPVERKLSLVAGKVEGSLFESMETLGEQAQLVLDFAEIFAWDRDGGGYYTPAGESLRRAFLKTPLEFTRISSGYSRGRRHPILGGVRPHLAIDYAAPQGTPIWAVAEGTVEFAGWSGGNGYTVTLRHRANFKTMYNHLSRFGKGIRPGAPVKQRQVIGYVGTTGLSTGPHLDYRVVKDGRFVNPLKQTFLPGKPISPPARPAFLEARDSLLGQLRSALAARSGTPPKS
jgi:murein DD-endopeptidase MepM/ murein hydrolase activator NlpD